MANEIYTNSNISGDKGEISDIYGRFRYGSDLEAFPDPDDAGPEGSPARGSEVPAHLFPPPLGTESMINIGISAGMIVGIVFSRLDFGWIGPVAPIWSGCGAGLLLSWLYFGLTRSDARAPRAAAAR